MPLYVQNHIRFRMILIQSGNEPHTTHIRMSNYAYNGTLLSTASHALLPYGVLMTTYIAFGLLYIYGHLTDSLDPLDVVSHHLPIHSKAQTAVIKINRPQTQNLIYGPSLTHKQGLGVTWTSCINSCIWFLITSH